MVTLKEKVKVMERDGLINAFTECPGVMAKAAKKLGVLQNLITCRRQL
jgi:transcriptional regulator with GAF, ATPase, and Fis domain